MGSVKCVCVWDHMGKVILSNQYIVCMGSALNKSCECTEQIQG